MTATDFRRIALSFDGAEQGSHMGAVDEPASSATSLLIIVTSCVLAVSVPALRAARIDPNRDPQKGRRGTAQDGSRRDRCEVSVASRRDTAPS
jgi:hypothetical protein